VNREESMRVALRYGIVLSLMMVGHHANAQSQPATIPTIVAQATAFEPTMFGRPEFFDGRTPTGWPAALVPPEAKVVGGGVVGDSAMFRMLTAVFAFSGRSNPMEVVRGLLVRAGYTLQAAEPPRNGGGFVGTESPAAVAKYCRGSTFATFELVDSVHAPLVLAVHLIDGEGGRQNCSTTRDRMMSNRFPVTVPPLSPPRGVVSFGGGSSWGGSTGSMRLTLRTTLSADSLLTHYTVQLVAGGWTLDGKPAVTDGVGVQRFSFREGQEAWTAALVILTSGERREVLLEFTKRE
jgi:hypothetical protein